MSDLEGDSVRLRVEYSVNGVDWNRASIVGDTLIGRSRYSGYLIWRSGLDLPNYGGDVISDNSGWGMYLYGVNSGIARGNLVSGNGSGVFNIEE